MNVSAIIPVFNSVNTLERAVKSLLDQIEIDEILLIDDGSFDGSFELELKMERENRIIKLLTHPNRINKGASSSRNLGLQYCKNEWVQFLDSDDELLPNKIKNNFNYINGNTSFLVGNSFYVKNDKKFKRHYWKNKYLGLIVTRLGNTCSNLWRKELLLKIGGWNENLSSSQEYDLIFRLVQLNSNISFCPEYLSIIYEIPDSISRNELLKEDRIKNSVFLRKSIKDYLVQKNKYRFKEKLFFNGIIGSISRKYNLNEKYSRKYFLLFKIFKGLSDRFLKSDFTIN